jgi:hypothetical protein
MSAGFRTPEKILPMQEIQQERDDGESLLSHEKSPRLSLRSPLKKVWSSKKKEKSIRKLVQDRDQSPERGTLPCTPIPSEEERQTATTASTPTPQDKDFSGAKRSTTITSPSSSRRKLPLKEVTVITEEESTPIPGSPSEYHLQLKASQAMVERLTGELKRTKSQVLDLIQQNQFMLKQLKAMDERQKDGNLMDANTQLKQENLMLKLAMTASMIFVLCGGRAHIIAIASVIYFVVDVLA